MVMCTLQNLHLFLDGGDDGDDLEVSLRKTISLNIELIHMSAYCVFSLCPFTKKLPAKSLSSSPFVWSGLSMTEPRRRIAKRTRSKICRRKASCSSLAGSFFLNKISFDP